MATLKELVAQKEAIEAQIAETIKSEKKEAIHQVKALIAEYGLTLDDVFGAEKRVRKAAHSPVAAKYRDPASGETWSGRGRAPKWIAGKNRDNFAV